MTDVTKENVELIEEYIADHHITDAMRGLEEAKPALKAYRELLEGIATLAEADPQIATRACAMIGETFGDLAEELGA